MPQKLSVRSYLFMFFVSAIGRAICRLQLARGRLILHDFDKLAAGLAEGKSVILANHLGRIEDVLIQVNTPGLWRHPARRYLWVVADSDPFGRFAGFMARNARCIMFRRNDPRSAVSMLRTVKQKVRDEMSVLIYVEGGRTFGTTLTTPLLEHNGRTMRKPIISAERMAIAPDVKLFLVWFDVPFAREETRFCASLWRWLTTSAVIQIRVKTDYRPEASLTNDQSNLALAQAIMSA